MGCKTRRYLPTLQVCPSCDTTFTVMPNECYTHINPIHHFIFYWQFHISWGGHHPPSSKVRLKNFFASKLQSWWSKGKHSWLWIWRPRVRIPAHPAFSLRKRKGTAGIWTQDPWFQSQLCLPLDHKLMKNAWKIKKNLATYFQIQNSLNFW